jgi:hypothetical protein
VHAGDGDTVLQPHQLGQHLGALDDGNVDIARRAAAISGLSRLIAELVHDDFGTATFSALWPSCDLARPLRQPLTLAASQASEP